jgi:hypothetical protein
VAPEVPPDLAGCREHGELVRPRSQPALAAELADLPDDRDHRVGGGLMCEII